MHKEDFLLIIDKYLSGTASAAEEELLLNYYKSFQQSHEWNEAELGPAKILEARLLQRLKAAVADQGRPKADAIPFYRKYAWIAAAAAFILLAGTTYWWLNNASKQPSIANINNSAKKTLKNDLPPGGNKALLTLADGKAIVLDSAQNGEIIRQGTTNVMKPNSGELVYNNAASGKSEVVYNTVTTPRGGQYHIVLADGTKVWLNAASSLYFPTSFTGKERRVEITGEAYFEVAHVAANNGQNRVPFFVKIKTASGDGGEVEVLGTHFNIMAFNDEKVIRTTLLEGSVKYNKAGKTAFLKPGQQAKLNTGNSDIKVLDDVDTEEELAWKNGMFEFNNAGLEDIMRQITRWYDVEVSYEGKIPADHFNGKVSRNTNLSNVIKILSLSDIHFRIEGKKIIVTS